MFDIEIEDVYSEEADRTIIFQNTYKDGKLKSIICIGWYHGEPSIESDKQYAGKLVAEYGEK